MEPEGHFLTAKTGETQGKPILSHRPWNVTSHVLLLPVYQLFCFLFLPASTQTNWGWGCAGRCWRLILQRFTAPPCGDIVCPIMTFLPTTFIWMFQVQSCTLAAILAMLLQSVFIRVVTPGGHTTRHTVASQLMDSSGQGRTQPTGCNWIPTDSASTAVHCQVQFAVFCLALASTKHIVKNKQKAQRSLHCNSWWLFVTQNNRNYTPHIFQSQCRNGF